MRALEDEYFSGKHNAQKAEGAADEDIAEEMSADHNAAQCN